MGRAAPHPTSLLPNITDENADNTGRATLEAESLRIQESLLEYYGLPDPDWEPEEEAAAGAPRLVLVLGGTGVCGAGVIAELLRRGVGVVAPVRAATMEEARKRLATSVSWVDKKLSIDPVRVMLMEPSTGAYAERMGMAPVDYEWLKREVGAIVNMIGRVKFDSRWSKMWEDNVLSLLRVIDFAYEAGVAQGRGGKGLQRALPLSVMASPSTVEAMGDPYSNPLRVKDYYHKAYTASKFVIQGAYRFAATHLRAPFFAQAVVVYVLTTDYNSVIEADEDQFGEQAIALFTRLGAPELNGMLINASHCTCGMHAETMLCAMERPRKFVKFNSAIVNATAGRFGKSLKEESELVVRDGYFIHAQFCSDVNKVYSRISGHPVETYSSIKEFVERANELNEKSGGAVFKALPSVARALPGWVAKGKTPVRLYGEWVKPLAKRSTLMDIDLVPEGVRGLMTGSLEYPNPYHVFEGVYRNKQFQPVFEDFKRSKL